MDRPRRANAGMKLKVITALERTDHVDFYFPLGCKVNAAWKKSKGVQGVKGMKDWHPGYVKGYNTNGTYFIQFSDGDQADGVPGNEIELREPPSGRG